MKIHLFTHCYYGKQINRGETSRAHSMQQEQNLHTKCLSENLMGSNHLGCQSMDEKII